MSSPDLYGTLFPDISRPYMADWFGRQSFPLYKGDTFNGNLTIYNSGTEKSGAFNVDLYISTDKTVDASDRYISTYTFADGIDGESSSSTFYDFQPQPIDRCVTSTNSVFPIYDNERR